ncbi:GNAT family N-acetyltransferase [Bradyrhizobium sp. BEA-2-5]|uniref:GNAT family N-acetyltransferase n=1 Tax=Bradyrhizobium sp. BEA-2-5 TaxID=3080015 RepID=UPI00293E5D5E|nr:GNAT family N-acetyltransferase [Bradyrhizobium sp. BEA-2-5]WOH80333.1 GNAT family N-acetyltransferase [Bradyrhizobium sp. BEA-2-5]
MRATLKALSHSDYATVDHLRLEPEQEQFVVPLDLLFSELRTSSQPELEHPFSIVVHDETVGFFILREKAALPEWAPPDAITLHNLCVGRPYQGNGYGKAATGLAAQWILTNRPCVNRLMLGVNIRNVRARGAYLKSGFRDTEATHCGPIGPQNILEYKIGSGG